MKKIIAALLVLALAAPAFATTVTATQISGTEVKISYSGGTPVPRGFGIDVTLDTAAIFDSSTEISTDYWVTLSTLGWRSSSRIASPFVRDPVADADVHPDTLPGYDSNGVTLEMGSLYGNATGLALTIPASAPPTTGDLVTLVVDVNLITEPNLAAVGMANNTARGGIVLEGGGAGSTYNGTAMYISTLNRAEFTVWKDTWGSGNPANAPKNWLGYCWKCGDVDNNGYLSSNDIIVTLNKVKGSDPTNPGEADADMNGYLSSNDIIVVLNNVKGGTCKSLGCTGMAILP